MAQEGNDERESRRVLDRLARETEAGGLVQHTSRRAQDHFAATDVDPNDRIEKWGTRIGRLLAALLSIAVIVAVFLYLTQG